MKRYLLVLCGLLTLPLMAQSGWWNSCNYGCSLKGDWEFGAQALYLSPMQCEFDYAKELDRTQQGIKVFSSECSPRWGLRLFGIYTAGCNFVKASYQWYEASEKHTLTGPQNLQMRGADVDFSTVSFGRFLRYQNADVRLGGDLYMSPHCRFYLFGNARWVDLTFERRLRGVVGEGEPNAGESIIFSERAQVGGGAGGVGLGTHIPILCGVGFFGEANAMGLIANRRNNDTFARDELNNDEATLQYKQETCISPEALIRIGIDYLHVCPCWSLSFELGYEVDYFWNPFGFPFDKGAPFTVANDWQRTCEDIGVSGLFFGASFHY